MERFDGPADGKPFDGVSHCNDDVSAAAFAYEDESDLESECSSDEHCNVMRNARGVDAILVSLKYSKL